MQKQAEVTCVGIDEDTPLAPEPRRPARAHGMAVATCALWTLIHRLTRDSSRARPTCSGSRNLVNHRFRCGGAAKSLFALLQAASARTRLSMPLSG